MKNLLESTDVATLFLDEDMRIKRFTAAARQIVALRPSDIGRPVNELASNLDYDQLADDAEEVLETLAPKDLEVRTKDGHWYLLRIMPYRTTQNVISGLVCTFRDYQRVPSRVILGYLLAASASLLWAQLGGNTIVG
jgi:two-component system CheB/CheR fusion protein